MFSQKSCTAVAVIAGIVAAIADRGILHTRIGVRGEITLRADLQPIERAALEIHDAGDGIRAIYRGGPSCNDINSSHERLRNDTDIRSPSAAGDRQAMAVEEHQITILTEPAQVDRRVAVASQVGDFLTATTEKLRHLLERLL